jgi:hypothetical protein
MAIIPSWPADKRYLVVDWLCRFNQHWLLVRFLAPFPYLSVISVSHIRGRQFFHQNITAYRVSLQILSDHDRDDVAVDFPGTPCPRGPEPSPESVHGPAWPMDGNSQEYIAPSRLLLIDVALYGHSHERV